MKRLLGLLLLLFFVSPALGAVQQINGFETRDELEAFDPGGGTSNVQTTTKRTGAAALQCTATTTATVYHEIGCPAAGGGAARCNIANVFFRFYFRYATKAASGSEEFAKVTRSTDSSFKAKLMLNSAGNIVLLDSTGSTIATGASVLAAGTWYRIEGNFPASTSATGTVRLNGVSEASGTGNWLSSNFGAIQFGKTTNTSSETIDYFYDDLSYDDAAYPGEGQVTRLEPTSNGTTAQYTSGTAPSDFSSVDDWATGTHDTDTTIITKSAAASQQHLVNITDTSTALISGTINAVKAAIICRSTAGTAATGVRFNSGGTTSDSSTNAVGTTMTFYAKNLVTNPNGGLAWTTAAVDALQVGTFDTAAIATVRCTAMGAFVDWTAAAAATTHSLGATGVGS